MSEPVTISLQNLSNDIKLPYKQVQTVVSLIDEGYPIPFIARYRKDITGNLDEDAVRFIASELRNARTLAERKQTILNVVEALGVLSPELDKNIREAETIKELEDIYLPHKPKKQTFGTYARGRGLLELALEIIDEKVLPESLDQRAAEFINVDKKVKSAAEALHGAGQIIAEVLADKIEVIQEVRSLLRSDGTLVTKKIVEPEISQPLSHNTTQRNTDENKITQNTVTETTTEPPTTKSAQTETAESIAQPETEITESDLKVEAVDAVDYSNLESKDTDAVEGETEVDAEAEVIDEENETDYADEESVDVEDGSGLSSSSEGDANTETTDVAGEITEQFMELREAIVGEVITSAQAKIAAGKDKHKLKIKEDLKRRRKEERVREREHLARQFAEYFDFSCDAGNIPAHRILAFSRGERERILRVTIEIDENMIFEAVRDLAVPKDHKFADFLSGCLKDAIHRVLVPMLVRELRSDMLVYAEEHAVRISTRNLRSVLLQPPLKNKRILAIDPGVKHGSRVASLDEFGNILGHETLYFSGGAERKANLIKKLTGTIERRRISVIAIGYGVGTGNREVEMLISKLISERFAGTELSYTMISEVGMGAYVTSSTAREELPNYDLSLRRAVSIGRRLQDSLGEVVKIEVEHLGIGTYQQDVKGKRMRDALGEVVESCVNFTGVDVNTATPYLLRYVAGLNKFTARRIYDYRLENGYFRSREELLRVSGISGVTFTSCAGFLRVYSGDNPLDATCIHPENYNAVIGIIEKFGFSPADLKLPEKRRELSDKIAASNIQELAESYSAEFGLGVHAVADIFEQLIKWDDDPREHLAKPIFRKGALRFDELQVGDELVGTVSNVVEFGAFVDVGLQDPGLVHISQISNRYINDAYEAVAVGDVVRVWVTELDEKRRRISLTMLSPDVARESKRGGVAGESDDANAVVAAGSERKQFSQQRRDPRGHANTANRQNDNNTRTAPDTASKFGGEHSRGNNFAGNNRIAQPNQNSPAAQQGQRNRFARPDQRTSQTNQRSGANDTSPRSTVAGQDNRRNPDHNRDRGQGNFGRSGRTDRVREFNGKYPKTYVTATKPKELKPITEKMKQGKEPLRSFGDLAQFLGRVQVDDLAEAKKLRKESVAKPRSDSTNGVNELAEIVPAKE
ncbi:MAG: helix-hairpin-helix domain-containing protein [Planctomycetaceae bacterium]|jgi:transcriptional accessory protein Tex/SPT6|nr:helix-hairpin-helix domain-containing protein [Planctomycetaceae bacterium]